jgi:hypothetical protein
MYDEVSYDMEADIKSCAWMVEKVCGDQVYAQNLYAALCNNDFQRLEMWPILNDQTWSCSWRYAGGIIADVQGKGDYMDWYCSGIHCIGDLEQRTPEEWANLTPEQQKYIKDSEAFALEGTVTDEILGDLQQLGWTVIESKNDFNS